MKYVKLVTGLAGVGAAAVMWLPTSAGATICTVECGNGVPGEAGLSNALTTLASREESPGANGTSAAETAIGFRLAGNHNETVLALA